MIKNINSKPLSEEIKKRQPEYTEELSGFNDPDNHDGEVTHLQPDVLDCEGEWALESITTNRVSGYDGIPAELFQILKDDAVKVLHLICQQIWKNQQWQQDQEQGNAQNPSSQASTVCELRNSRCTSWIQKGRGTRD